MLLRLNLMTGCWGGQNDSLMFTAGNLCKLLLAAYLSILDVIIVRVLELANKGEWAPRKLLGVRAPNPDLSFL